MLPVNYVFFSFQIFVENSLINEKRKTERKEFAILPSSVQIDQADTTFKLKMKEALHIPWEIRTLRLISNLNKLI